MRDLSSGMQRSSSARHGTPSELTLASAEERNPEWRPWLGLLRLALAEVEAGWEVEIGLAPERTADAPLLHDAIITTTERRAAALVESLLSAAAAGGDVRHPVAASAVERVRPLPLLEAAIGLDHARIGEVAATMQGDAEALVAVAQLAAMPVLHACRRRLGRELPAVWQQGYCPVCAAWPALGEMRGLDRERRMRCARCGADWRLSVLRCPFCGETDHAKLGGLLVDGDEETRRVDICRTCMGYIKGVTTLMALPDVKVATEDVATLHLDFAAVDRGYGRPQRPAFDVRLTLAASGTRTLASLGERRWILAHPR